MSDSYGSFVAASSEIESSAGSRPPEPTPSESLPSSFNMGADDTSTSPQDAVHGGYIEPVIHCQPPKMQRNRRRTVPGPDHVKHRRTRSGCYTCRSRRVKCDETRPICNRCRKGQRECAYPEASPPSSKDSDAGHRESPTSSNECEEDASPDIRLPPIPDEDEGSASGSQQSGLPKRSLRRIHTGSSVPAKRTITQNRETSETPSHEDTRSTTSLMSESLAFNPTLMGIGMPEYMLTRKPDWTHLPSDFQVNLDYYYDNITHWKYGVHRDFDDFFHTTFINLALQNEPLLYAVVSFAAFKRILTNPNGKIHDFLQYYTHSLTLLLGRLTKRETHHDLATLLTILQLATMEEFFGDYANLTGHQKAAFEVLTQLFTPQSILQTSVGRVILAWYMRFDLLASTMGVVKPSLPRHWVAGHSSYCQARALAEPDNMEWMSESAEAQLGTISVDMCILVARRKAHELTEDEFRAEHSQLTTRLQRWRDHLHPSLTDAANLVVTSAPASPASQPKLFSYFPDHVPLYGEPFCFTTAVICEWHSMVLLHLCQATGDMRAEAEAVSALGHMSQHAAAVCEIIDAAERWPKLPKGLLMMLHPTLGMAAMFLPRSTRHHTWLREQFAWLESCGYVFPLAMRTRMAHLFEDETVVDWWLPNNEGFSPVLQSVRAFADERSHNPSSSMQHGHSQDMKEVFDALVNLRLQDPMVPSPERGDD